MGAPTPPTLLAAIASSASDGSSPGDKTNPMPENAPGGNAASVTGGFPAITMESELSGGLPPLGQDMNGFLFLLSSHTLYVESGQLYLYSSDLATALGGYAVGTVLGMSDGSGMWLNTAANNTSNPDSGGAGWVPLASYGFATVAGLTGGTVALTSAQGKKSVIVLSGTLASNLTVQLPANAQAWLIVNLTTGAFTTTVNAGGATGVQVPQGGYANPVPVYGLGDGNIYPQSAAANLPAYSQSTTGLTLAQRTNAGYVLATYFNSSASPSENPTIGSVAVMNSAADGFIRFATLANFFSQSIVQNLASGIITLPSGSDGKALKIVWGSVNGGSGVNAAKNVAVAFPSAFPNAVIGALATMTGTGGNDASYLALAVNGLNTAGFNLYFRNISSGAVNYTAFYLAIGY